MSDARATRTSPVDMQSEWRARSLSRCGPAGERNAPAMKGQRPFVLIGGNVTVRSAPRALVKMQTAHCQRPPDYAAVTPVSTSKMVSSSNFSPMEHGLNVPAQHTVLRLTDMYVLTRKSDATSSALSFISSRLISRCQVRMCSAVVRRI